MNRISLIFVLILGITITKSAAQTILLEQDVNADTIVSERGPNRTHFAHLYFGYGFILGESSGDGADIKLGLSNDLNIGIRYKFRINNWFALGGQAYYSYHAYWLEQDSTKRIPDRTLHTDERLSFHQFGVEFYNRFNFGRRGNIVGRYLDVGFYTDFSFITRHVTIDKQDPPDLGANTIENQRSGLGYTNIANYGISWRIGANRYVLYGKYRLSNLFNNSYFENNSLTPFPELPRLIIGIEIGLIR